jgi:CYTH domain-containing protein
MDGMEIERKFLVRDESYKTLASASVRICQGYLALNERCSVRVRRKDDKAYMTVKSKAVRGSFSRYEFEQEIPVAEAEQLLALCMPGKIEKTRWLVPLDGGLVCEVDEFDGMNKGLVMAEIELQSEQQEYPRPAFLGQEVTFDRRYFNSYLAQRPYMTWETDEDEHK